MIADMSHTYPCVQHTQDTKESFLASTARLKNSKNILNKLSLIVMVLETSQTRFSFGKRFNAGMKKKKVKKGFY